METRDPHSFPVEHALALVVIFLLALCIVIDLMAIVLGISQISLLSKQAAAGTDKAVHDLIRAIPPIAQLAAFLVTAVVFLIWIYRVHRNLPALGVVRPGYSPVWAVAWFFVPIMNLIRPYEVVRELWKDSNPDVGMSDAFFKQNRQSTRQYSSKSSLIGLWWGCWIASAVANRLYVMLLSQPGDNLEAASLTGMVCDALSMIGAAFAILIVREIDARQEEKHRRLIIDHGLQGERSAKAQSGNS